uniref:Glutaredoxin domain-containing protein n=1 Tax=Lotus japonicus TaxID=34305 RepID=I3S4X6_LOTJA|nr:unknown [Lotus japonicus]
MHQAIPYRSWRPHHHNPTTSFTPHPLITQYSHITTNNNTSNDEDKNKNKKSDHSFDSSNNSGSMVRKMVSENAVIVFGRRGCCMSHVVKRLLLGLGVNPATHEVEEKDEVDFTRELEAIIDDGKLLQFPVVFIGGKLFGGLERLMATHISGELVPLLKQAGALWL